MGSLEGGSTARRKAGRSMLAVGVIGTILILIWASGVLPTTPARNFLEKAQWAVVGTVLLAGIGAGLLWIPSDREREKERHRR